MKCIICCAINVSINLSLGTLEPTIHPSQYPTTNPTIEPTIYPSYDPTNSPTAVPSDYPTMTPTIPVYGMVIFITTGNNTLNVSLLNTTQIIIDQYIITQNLSTCIISKNYTVTKFAVNTIIIVCDIEAQNVLNNVTTSLSNELKVISDDIDIITDVLFRTITFNNTNDGEKYNQTTFANMDNLKKSDITMIVIIISGISILIMAFIIVFMYFKHKKRLLQKSTDQANIQDGNDGNHKHLQNVESASSKAPYTQGQELLEIEDMQGRKDSDQMYVPGNDNISTKGIVDAITHKSTVGETASISGDNFSSDTNQDRRDSEALYKISDAATSDVVTSTPSTIEDE